MRRSLLICLLATSTAGAAVAVALAQPTPGTEPTPGTSRPTPERPLSPEDQARRAKIVAKVGASTITLGDVEDAINAQSPFLRTRYRDPQRLREFVQNMVRFELLAQEADRRQYGRKAPVLRSTKQNAVQQLIRAEFDERITPESVPQEDVQAYYDEHPEEFSRPEMVRASHILLSDEATANELLATVRAADARSFRQLARRHSIDQETKLRGGDLRYFTAEGRPPNSQDAPVDAAIVRAAFEIAEVGDVAAQPVPVGEGNFSLVKLTGRRPAEHRSIAQAGQGIRLRLWRERRQQAIETFVAELRRRHRPEVHAERMAPIRLEAADPRPGFGERGGRPSGAPDEDDEDDEAEPAPAEAPPPPATEPR